MDIVAGILGFSVAAFAVAGIFWPRVRGVWRGTQVPVSIMTSIGFALIFGSVGVNAIWDVRIGIPLAVGFVLVLIGQFWDFRRGRKY